MDFADRNRIFWTKLQNLPEWKKFFILWTIVITLALVMGFFWAREAIDNFSKIGEEIQNIKMPEISSPSMPALNILETTTPGNKK